LKDENVKPLDKHCATCALPASFPGIRFDSKGVCNFCADYSGIEYQEAKKTEYRLKFESLIKECQGQSTYDALMCYSGGKDSTYTLTVLREKYKLNVLAVSFDNGFVPEQTLLNIRNVVENLDVDYITIKPRFDVLARIFRYCADNAVYPAKALERSSAICTSCMGIIKYSALRLAIEKNIPFITYGWSPGQAPIHSSILKNNAQMVRMMQKTLYNRLHQIVGDVIQPYFLEDKHFNGSGYFPYNINPLAFLDYNIEAIYKSIKRFGWKRPKDTDANSTNCLLNSFATVVHKQKLGFHPYAFEMANLVREGYIDRTTALERLYQQENPHILKIVKKKLRLKGDSFDD
jgi:hypothetical protein